MLMAAYFVDHGSWHLPCDQSNTIYHFISEESCEVQMPVQLTQLPGHKHTNHKTHASHPYKAIIVPPLLLCSCTYHHMTLKIEVFIENCVGTFEPRSPGLRNPLKRRYRCLTFV